MSISCRFSGFVGAFPHDVHVAVAGRLCCSPCGVCVGMRGSVLMVFAWTLKGAVLPAVVSVFEMKAFTDGWVEGLF